MRRAVLDSCPGWQAMIIPKSYTIFMILSMTFNYFSGDRTLNCLYKYLTENYNPDGRPDLTTLFYITAVVLASVKSLLSVEVIGLPILAIINWRRSFPALKGLFYREDRVLVNYDSAVH
jgi:hypothetical protein